MNDDYPRPVVHWEIQARDPDSLRAFYGELFSWRIDDGPIMTISPGFGGPEPGPGGHILAGGRSAVVLYVQVRDLAESLALAETLGGRATGQPFDVPGGPTIASIEDPEGNRVVLVQQ